MSQLALRKSCRPWTGAEPERDRVRLQFKSGRFEVAAHIISRAHPQKPLIGRQFQSRGYAVIPAGISWHFVAIAFSKSNSCSSHIEFKNDFPG